MKVSSNKGELESILICEDEVLLARDMARSVENLGYRVAGLVTSGEAAIELCKKIWPNLILMDIRLEGSLDGIETAESIRKEKDIPVVYVSAYSEGPLMERMKRSHPYGYISKPASAVELRTAIELALYKHHSDMAVKKSETRAKAIVDNYPWGALFLFDKDLRYTYCGGKGLAEVGLDPKQTIGKTIYEVFPPSVTKVVEAHCRPVFEGISSEYEVEYKNRFFYNHATPIIGEDGAIEEGAVFTQDITDRKRARQEIAMANETLARSEKQKTDILNAIGEMVAYQDREGKVIWANRVSAESVGEAPESLEGRRCFEIWHGRNSRCVECPPFMAFETGEPSEGEVQSPDGRYWRLRGYPVKDNRGRVTGIVEVGRDITSEKRAKDIIESSLKEKEALLREVHHRVKNNLAVINSLLNLQADFATDRRHREMFMECQNRIRSMAVAHELLYSSGDLGNIKADEYVGSLVEHLSVCYGVIGADIRVKTHVEDIALSLDTAIPMGFIITELVSNSFKHGFPRARSGEITVALRSRGDQEITLTVRDNGVGIPDHVELDSIKSLGLELVETFASQLSGEMVIKRDNGLQVEIHLKKDPVL
jgi:PAS domain S-box-containing protein